MATISMENLWNFLHSISLTDQNKLWLAEHLYEDVKEGEKKKKASIMDDEWGIPCPSNEEEAKQLIEEADKEDEMVGEVPIEDLLEETEKFIKEHEDYSEY